MKQNENQEAAGDPQNAELSSLEQRLLHMHLDRTRINRWEQVIAQTEKKRKTKIRTIQLIKWATGIAATFLLLLLCKDFFSGNDLKPQLGIAGLVAYPFMEQQVRGTSSASPSDEVWKKGVSNYQKGDYAQALADSKTLDNPFFEGMCLMQLKQFEAADKQFTLALNRPGFPAEMLYYKAFALQQLGRKSAAKALLNQALSRSDLRDLWKKAAEKMMRELNTVSPTQ